MLYSPRLFSLSLYIYICMCIYMCSHRRHMSYGITDVHLFTLLVILFCFLSRGRSSYIGSSRV